VSECADFSRLARIADRQRTLSGVLLLFFSIAQRITN